tara:strand:- start:668 stop:3547 length:2880 start_codon:yes stop_codon:yes gene_type:complete
MSDNFLGGPFNDVVRGQVNVRQEALGKHSKIPSQDLQYYTTKTPFLRLASSVNLTKGTGNSVLEKLSMSTGIPESEIINDNLSKRFILQGGVVNHKTGKMNFGLNQGEDLLQGAYGWGGSTERGYVPMPGIINADVTYYNDGAFSKAVINCKVFSKTQFSLFDVLYLRPGYTLLMEFGWTQYLDNDGKLQNMEKFMTPPLSAVLNGKVTQFEMYDKIKKHRGTTFGNYDAVFGKISKFSWKLNNDGSYDCQIVLTSMGDLISSLKVNITDPNTKLIVKETPQPNSEGGTEPIIAPPLIANQNKTVINKELFKIYQDVLLTSSKGWSDYTCKSYMGLDSEGKSKIPADVIFPNCIFSLEGTTTDDQLNQSPQVFIKYGAFLAFIQSRLLLQNTKDNSTIVSFDMNFDDLDKDSNVILKLPGEFSADPRVCMIPWSNSVIPSEGLNMPESSVNKALSESSWNFSQYLGRIGQILINVNYISRCLESAKKEKGDINLLALLKSINSGIMQSLGGINDFEIKLDDENPSLIKFIENIPQRRDNGDSVAEGTYTRFNVFGVKPGVGGSFVRNTSLTADLSDDFATMITIGAQANSNQLSENSVSFSNYSEGLVDRVIEEKLSQTPKADTIDEPAEVPKTITSNWDNNINPTENSLFVSTYGTLQWTEENLSSLISHNKTHASLLLGELTKKKFDGGGAQLQSPQFLPFNLSLEMDGLSGMKLYQKFLMSDNVLPPSYEGDSIDIQIKGINHSINSSAWITKLDTQSVTAEKLGSIIRPKDLKSTITKQKSSSAPSKNKGSCIEKYSNEQYSVTAGGSYKILATYKFSGDDPRAGLSLQGKPLSTFPKLMKSSDGVPLPKAGYGVARKAFEALPVIGAAATAQGINGLTINSNYRSPVYNCTVGGASNSMHKTGGAIDIGTRSPKKLYNLILKLISENKIPQGGVGLYNSFVHYDIRGSAARWKI